METHTVRPNLKSAPRSLFRLGRLLRAVSPLADGVVSLVGAGPGDPGLLTLKAARRLGEADVVYHDALVSEAILELCRPGIRLVPVGKRRGSQTMPQEQIVAALVRDAQAGLRVVRLKGGDPFVFGRGGEEALALLESGVPFEVVPGISSGIAVPAVAGIPLTHRGIASSAAFITAHTLGDDPEGKAVRARLRHLARGADTLVVFMAGAELQGVRRSLLDAGLPAGTPVALIESGTLPDERVARGTLGRLPSLLALHHGGPVLVVVGKTVRLADALRPGVALAGTREAAAISPAMAAGSAAEPASVPSLAAALVAPATLGSVKASAPATTAAAPPVPAIPAVRAIARAATPGKLTSSPATDLDPRITFHRFSKVSSQEVG